MTMHPWQLKHRPLIPAIVLPVVIMTFFLAACAPAASTGSSDECGPIEPTGQDINKILSFGGEAFASENWVRSYSVEPYKMTLLRQNAANRAIAHIEYLIYTCGYGQAEMDEYFNDAGFDIAFEAYESHAMSTFCEEDGLAFYKFDLVDEGMEYTSHYWVEQTDDTHVLAVMLVFPKTSTALLDEYSQKLFSELNSCQ